MSFFLKIIECAFLAIIIGCKNQTSTRSKTLEPVEVSGVVTYLFNRNFGDRPDIGSEVYLALQSNVNDFNIGTLDSFLRGTFYRNIYLSYKQMGVKAPSDVLAAVDKYQVKDTGNYYALLGRAINNEFKIMFATDVIKTVVDGNGSFSLKLIPGDYYMIIESKQRHPAFYFERLMIMENRSENVTHNFIPEEQY